MKIPSGSARRKYTYAENSKENMWKFEKKTCAVSEGSFLHEEGALGRATTSRGCKARMGRGRDKRKGREWDRVRKRGRRKWGKAKGFCSMQNSRSKNEIRNRNRKRNSKLGLGRSCLATAQQQEGREEGRAVIPHNSADKGALCCCCYF